MTNNIFLLNWFHNNFQADAVASTTTHASSDRLNLFGHKFNNVNLLFLTSLFSIMFVRWKFGPAFTTATVAVTLFLEREECFFVLNCLDS